MPTANSKSKKQLRVKASELAAICGVHVTTVSNWTRSGLPCERKGRDALIEVQAGVQWMKRGLEEDVARLREAAAGSGAKDRKVAAEARMAELKVEREEALIVPAAEVRDRWVEIISALREAMLSVPGVAVQSGLVTREAEDELATIVRDALSAYSNEGTSDE